MNHANFAQTTLGAAITDTSGTSITVTSEAGFPAVPFIISVDTEAMLVTNVATTTWTVTRGYESSTAATHLNGAAVYHDWSAGEANSAVLGPSSATDAHLAVFDGATGKLLKDGGAVPAAGLPTTGGTMSGPINMGNQDISYLKLLQLNGEIDDGIGAAAIDWNAGVAHKVTLTAAKTLTFTGYGAGVTAKMTSANTPSGVVSGPTQLSGAAWNAFDQDGASYSFPANGGPYWLQYQFPVAHSIALYGLYRWVRNDNSTALTLSWTLKGSNNGTDWTTLDTRTSVVPSADGWSYYTIASPASYLYYRIDVTSTNYVYMLWHEISLLEFATTDPLSPCFVSLKIVQDGTGGWVITWPATVKGTPLYDLAANAVTNLLFYWDGTYYWLLNNSGRVSVPASATAKGLTGQWAANGSYYYFCSATDTWVRTALATWT